MAIILYEYAGGDRPEEKKLSTVDPPNEERHNNETLHSRVFSWKFGLGLRKGAGIMNWGRMLRPTIEERIEE